MAKSIFKSAKNSLRLPFAISTGPSQTSSPADPSCVTVELTHWFNGEMSALHKHTGAPTAPKGFQTLR